MAKANYYSKRPDRHLFCCQNFEDFGHNVVEDYQHVGLTLRAHQLSFLRRDLAARRIVTCADAMNARDKSWLCVAGLVLVRQKPSSAKGVMFLTIEDETGPANVVVWPSLFEKRRRVVLGAAMMAIQGKIQREGDVVHLIARQLDDLSDDLSSLSDRGVEFRNPSGRGDEFAHGSPGGGDARDRPSPNKARDIFIRDLHIETLKAQSESEKLSLIYLHRSRISHRDTHLIANRR